jgi:hypothetical protein
MLFQPPPHYALRFPLVLAAHGDGVAFRCVDEITPHACTSSQVLHRSCFLCGPFSKAFNTFLVPKTHGLEEQVIVDHNMEGMSSSEEVT